MAMEDYCYRLEMKVRDYECDIQGVVNAPFAKLLSGDITAEEFVAEVQAQLG